MTSQAAAIQYPESDGEPMGETQIHRDLITDLIFALDQHFLGAPQVYISGNMFLYYEEGNPEASCCPDVFLAHGVSKEKRRVFKVWEEGGKTPDLIIEVTSSSSKFKDLGVNRVLYAQLDVGEYYLFDPMGEYLDPPFMGLRLAEGEYIRMEPSKGRFKSETTGLELGVHDGRLRFFVPGAAMPLRTPQETEEARREAEEARREAEEKLQTSEEEKQRLAEEIERLKEELRKRSPDSSKEK